jgi:hypothetical protein
MCFIEKGGGTREGDSTEMYKSEKGKEEGREKRTR